MYFRSFLNTKSPLIQLVLRFRKHVSTCILKVFVTPSGILSLNNYCKVIPVKTHNSLRVWRYNVTFLLTANAGATIILYLLYHRDFLYLPHAIHTLPCMPYSEPAKD